MKRLAVYLTALFVCSKVLADEEDASRALDGDLQTWSRLKRDAGYFTESGNWRGGFYRLVRSTETETYHCLNHTDTHCTSWSVSEVSRKKRETGTCTCEETDSSYCQRWSCRTRFNYDCSTPGRDRRCVARDILTCHCVQSARNEQYCWKWHCREDNIAQDRYELEDYECVDVDDSGDFCYRWHGNTSSKYALESSACECFQRGSGYCQHWRCRERGLYRCDRTGQGWCRLEISIGVGGGVGLFLFAFYLAVVKTCCLNPDEELHVATVVGAFCILCLPWTIGVVIWGGVFGLPWVLLMWLVALTAIFGFLNRERIKPNMPAMEMPTLSAKQTHVVEDAASDMSNHV